MLTLLISNDRRVTTKYKYKTYLVIFFFKLNTAQCIDNIDT